MGVNQEERVRWFSAWPAGASMEPIVLVFEVGGGSPVRREARKAALFNALSGVDPTGQRVSAERDRVTVTFNPRLTPRLTSAINEILKAADDAPAHICPHCGGEGGCTDDCIPF